MTEERRGAALKVRPRRARACPPKPPWGGRERLVVVPLDGSVEAKAALPAARLLAGITRASIHLVHATDHALSHEDLLHHMGLRREETRNTVIDEAIGMAAEAIARLAEEKRAMLIVMTTRGRTAYLGRTVRPVVERIISDAPCPVLLVRPEIAQRVSAMKKVRRILLPLDGAPSSAAVIAPALNLAEQSGAEVDILFVATQAPRPHERGTLTAPRYIDQPQYEWPTWAGEFTTRFATSLGECIPPRQRHLFLRSGDPGPEIVHFALERNSDLIALEWRGRLDPDRAKVARRVLEEAPCPVLLLRTAPGPYRP